MKDKNMDQNKPIIERPQLNTTHEIKLNPINESIKIIVYYVLISFLWIFGSDAFVNVFIDDSELISQIQTIKGIFFVLLSGAIFYLIIFKKLSLYVESIIKLRNVNENLEIMNENSIKLDQKLFQLAYYDELTGLPNKILLEEKVNTFLKSNPEHMMALVYMDIDEFRNVNEVKGHQIGDELIKKVADVMNKHVKEKDVLCHTGADEFVVAVFDIKDLANFLSEIEEFFKKIKKTYVLDKDDYYITFSGGVALAPDHGHDYITLLRHADSALSMAKNKGKDQLVIFDDEMVTMITQQTELLNQLRNAIPNHEFSLHYQPVIDLKDSSIIGAEALIRWNNKSKGYIPPLEFISLSEKNGYIKEITEWVFYQVAKDISKWPKKKEDFKISINISAVMLIHDSFLKYLNKWIKQYQIDCKQIILEITETAVITDIDRSIHVLLQLRKMGFTIALDDFGTGYSSLTYLQRLPIDIIKIDRGFINNINKDTKEFHVLKYMIDLAHHLNMKVVAEGIEIIEQQNIVKTYLGDLAQGYYYCKPMPKEQLIDFIKAYKY
jgi:diguanylate cyclase (GGDEF)-like protein